MRPVAEMNIAVSLICHIEREAIWKRLCLLLLVKQATLLHKERLLMLSITDLMKESMASLTFCFGYEDEG